MTIPERNNLREGRGILYHDFKVSDRGWLDPMLWAEREGRWFGCRRMWRRRLLTS